MAFSLEFQKISQSLEQFFLTVGEINFGNKIPFFPSFLATVAHIKKVEVDRQRAGKEPHYFRLLSYLEKWQHIETFFLSIKCFQQKTKAWFEKFSKRAYFCHFTNETIITSFYSQVSIKQASSLNYFEEIFHPARSY